MLPAIDAAKSAPTIIAHRLQPTGALREDALYIERSADQDLLSALSAGEFCYVLAPRQIGKSSLRARTARRLKRAGTHCAEIDLTSLGKSADRDPVGTWYFSLANRIADDLALADPKPFFESLAALLPVERFGQFLRRQVLPQVAGHIVIFLDEIDYVRALPIDCDEFFVALRALYNERPQHPELERLTFCLLGVAAPRDLVRDPHITPFNIGQPIRLIDFRRDELGALAPALAPLESDPAGWLDEIYAWTAGHPYMTQVLCQELVKQRGAGAQGTAAERVQRAVSMRFLRSGRSVDENLSYAEKRLQQSPHKAELLILYRRLLDDARVPLDTGDAIQQELMMCGLAALREAREPQPLLQVRNRVFARVFDAAWVQEKEAQRLLTTAYRRWHEAGGRDVDLLSAEDLALAQAWAQEHPREVSSQEHEFLLRCVDHARQKAEQDKLLSESNLARERLRSAEQSTRTQRRIIFGLLLSILLLAGLSLALYLQYRRAQAAAAAEATARTAAVQAAAREADAARKAQELAQAEVAARKQIEALAAAKQQEWERAEAQQREASTAKAVAEQKVRELDDQIHKTREARADLDESRRQNDSVSAARLAMSPEHRLPALVLGLRAVLPDIKSHAIHPSRWEGLTTAATPLVGSYGVPTRRRYHTICSAISSDAQQVALGSEDGTVELYSVGASKPLWTTKAHRESVWHLSFSDNKRYLASSGLDGMIQIIDTKSGAIVSHQNGIGRYFHADFVDKFGKVQISSFSNPLTEGLMYVLPGGIPVLYSAKSNNPKNPYFDDSHGVISIRGDNIKIDAKALALSASPNGELIAGTFTKPDSTSILDGQHGHLLRHLSSRWSAGLHFTPDGKRILTHRWSGEARIWDLRQVIGESWQTPLRSVDSDFCLSEDGRSIVEVYRKRLLIYSPSDRNKKNAKTLVPSLPNQFSRVQRIREAHWAQQDRLVWAVGYIDEVDVGNKFERRTAEILHVWRAMEGSLLRTAEGPAFSRIAVSGNGEKYFVADGRLVRSFRVSTGELISQWFPSESIGSTVLIVDAQGLRVAIYSSVEDKLHVYDDKNGAIISELDTKGIPNFYLDSDTAQFAPSGRYLAARAGRELFMADVAAQRAQRLSGHLGAVSAFAFSPDERLIASAADDKTVRLWQVDTGKQWLVVPVDEPVRQLRFIEGGTRILALQKNGVARTFPVDHLAYFRHGCRVLRGYSSITGVSEADLKEALSACPQDEPAARDGSSAPR